MIDDHSLILPFLPTPQTVGYPVEMMESIRMVNTGYIHDLWGLLGTYWAEELQPLSRVFRALLDYSSLCHPVQSFLDLIDFGV